MRDSDPFQPLRSFVTDHAHVELSESPAEPDKRLLED